MATRILEAIGLNGPEPLLIMTLVAADLREGDILEVVADYPGFAADVATWCLRLKKTLLTVVPEGVYRTRAQIRF